jgi:EAL domain-containing protein (putative c-di-GMP-specific phosphodiesterase class I)
MYKLDKSFVDDIGSDRNADAFCDAIRRLGQSLGTKVIAEGVETEVQTAFLRQRRCDEVQGYFLGKPVPVNDFERDYLSATQTKSC